MDAHDRPVRFVIFVLYALAATQMVWSGAAYRLVMPELVPLLALTALLFWLFAASQISWPRRRPRRWPDGDGAVGSPGGSGGHGVSAGSSAGGGKPGLARGIWLSGLLYALFSLPAAVYLIDSVLRLTG